MSIEERIDSYIYQILQRLAEMDIDQLEREVLLLEEESGDFPRNAETSRLIERQIHKLVASLLNNNSHGGKIDRDGKSETPKPPTDERSQTKTN